MEALGQRLGERDRRVAELGTAADRLSERVVERERELRRLRGELEALRAEAERLRAEREQRFRALAAVAEDLAGVRRQARGQATRIRLRALRDAAALGRSMDDALGASPESREELLAAVREAIGRIGVEDDEEALAADSNGAWRLPGAMFDGQIELEIGPLDDFAKLVGFEDAIEGIGATDEISVKRFTKGRATLEMRLGEPVELLRELEERTPFEFRVRDQRPDRLVLDVDEE
jgi:hypothetical protein